MLPIGNGFLLKCRNAHENKLLENAMVDFLFLFENIIFL